MKRNNLILTSLLTLILLSVACEKKVAPIDDYSVTVEYKSSGAKYVTGNLTISPKDSLFFDFTITSAVADIAVVEIQKNNAKIDTFKMAGSGVRSFSALKKYMSDSASGDYTYRILARDAKGVFLGDGDKQIKVTITPDFVFHSYRFLYVPDSTAKTNKCYLSTVDGKVYSYTDGAAKSADIDFGYFYDTTTTGAPKHTIYALTASAFLPYDISTWTKNATILKKGTTPAFSTLLSSGGLNSAGISNLASGTSNKVTALASGNLVFFRTAKGKYGCLQVNFIEGSNASPNTYLNVDVKVQK